jgi:hypothetical protein
MISLRDIVAGVLIGAASTSWFAVAICCVSWGFFAWLIIALLAGRSEYTLGTVLFFGSPAFTRFIVWWTTAFVTSLLAAALTYGAREYAGLA